MKHKFDSKEMQYGELLNDDIDHEELMKKRAVALKYNQDNAAPRVTAKGKGVVAENILRMGQNSSVPVYQNKTLVSMLMAVELDREIPPEMYTAVAEVLAHVYRIDQKKRKNSVPNINIQ